MKLDPLKDWYSDVSNFQKLTAILNDVTFKEAVKVLEFVARPRSDLQERSSADAITRDAMQHKRCEGFFSFVEHLYQLTEPLTQAPEKLEPYDESYVREYARRKGMIVEEDKAAES